MKKRIYSFFIFLFCTCPANSTNSLSKELVKANQKFVSPEQTITPSTEKEWTEQKKNLGPKLSPEEIEVNMALGISDKDIKNQTGRYILHRTTYGREHIQFSDGYKLLCSLNCRDIFSMNKEHFDFKKYYKWLYEYCSAKKSDIEEVVKKIAPLFRMTPLYRMTRSLVHSLFMLKLLDQANSHKKDIIRKKLDSCTGRVNSLICNIEALQNEATIDIHKKCLEMLKASCNVSADVIRKVVPYDEIYIAMCPEEQIKRALGMRENENDAKYVWLADANELMRFIDLHNVYDCFIFNKLNFRCRYLSISKELNWLDESFKDVLNVTDTIADIYRPIRSLIHSFFIFKMLDKANSYKEEGIKKTLSSCKDCIYSLIDCLYYNSRSYYEAAYGKYMEMLVASCNITADTIIKVSPYDKIYEVIGSQKKYPSSKKSVNILLGIFKNRNVQDILHRARAICRDKYAPFSNVYELLEWLNSNNMRYFIMINQQYFNFLKHYSLLSDILIRIKNENLDITNIADIYGQSLSLINSYFIIKLCDKTNSYKTEWACNMLHFYENCIYSLIKVAIDNSQSYCCDMYEIYAKMLDASCNIDADTIIKVSPYDKIYEAILKLKDKN